MTFLFYIIKFESHDLCEVLEFLAPVAVCDGIVLSRADAEHLLPQFLGRDDRSEDRVAVCCQEVLLVALRGVLLREAL